MGPLLALGAALLGFGFAVSARRRAPRRTQRYRVRSRGRIIDCGITNRELRTRQSERRRKHENPMLVLEPYGRRVTRRAGLDWEREMGCSPHSRPPRG